MAYNLESLLRIHDEILQPHNKTWILDDNHHNEVKSLFQKISSLKDLLENTSHLRGQQIEALEGEIRDASHEAEDIIEPNMIDQMLSKPNDTTFKIIPTNLSAVMEKFDAVIAKLRKINNQTHETNDARSSPFGASDSTSTEQDIVVGFDGDGLQLKGRLTSQTRELQIIPIVGMGGIGKTTLARTLYDDPLICSHFDARAWVTVSQDYSLRAILLDLLRCIVGNLSVEMQQESNVKLALVLHKSLCGLRYLVMVDDIWSTEAWDEIAHFFPRENLGSRIVLTTRKHDVAKHADPSRELHQMHHLNDLQSWELFQQVSLAVSDSTTSTKQDIVVGLDGDGLQLKGRLTSQTRKLQIVPIVGMGGIGKTTLARTLYDDPLIRSHFHARAWVTVSQDYSVRAILLDLLRCVIGKLSAEMMQAKNNKLAVILYQSLYGQRYLVVIDDIWSTEAWDEIKQCFPNDSLGSRILLTCRDLNVAKHADSSCELHQMHLLNDHQSWELFQHKAFGKEGCPPSLEVIGRKIAGNCGGLPLAINVIGGLLSENRNSSDLWDQVARDVSSVAAEKDEHFSKIFTQSYSNLPRHLRPCLLYMAAFPEDYEAPASKLARLWVAEGFLKPPSESKNLEEAAEEYLHALVNRNLLSVRRYRSDGKAKSYIIHDLLRELCVRKAREERFLWVKDRKAGNIQEGCLRRVSAHPSYRIRDVYASAEHMSLARSFLCLGPASHVILSPVFFALKLLRVLDVFQVKFPRFPEQVLQLANLRFLALSVGSDLPSEISRLRFLQTLIAELRSYHNYVDIPSELWDIPELRHLKLKSNIVLLYSVGSKAEPLEKLQTLSYISVGTLFCRFLTKVPNITKLGICSDFQSGNVGLGHLHNLATLRCWGYSALNTKMPLPEIVFPQSIRKLALDSYVVTQSFTSTIGSLPNLQVLKVRRCSFETDGEWEINEGEFGSLQYLLLYQVKNLVRWKDADDDGVEAHFPRLRHLVIQQCDALEEIPSSFRDIATLEKIELDDSNPTLVASARQFEDEQRDNGNESLQILIGR